MLFAFPEAFALNAQWLERHPDDLNALIGFAEKHLTTGRLAEAQARLSALLARTDVEPRIAAALRALSIPTLLALGQAAQVSPGLDALLAHITAQPEDFQGTWSFEGVTHFIGQYDSLAPYQPWLLQLFRALKAETRDAVLAEVQAVRQGFK